MRLRPKTVALVVLLLAGCGGGSGVAVPDEGCRPDDQFYPRDQPLTVAQALQRRPSELVAIRGAFFYREGERPRLCTRLGESYPPQCSGPSVAVEGLGNPYRIIAGLKVTGRDGLQPTKPRVAWGESTTGGGRLDGRVLRIEPACSSKRVIDHFREQTGDELAMDLNFSGAELEHLDFEALADQRAAGRQQRAWGRFTVAVFLRERDRALQKAFEQVSGSTAPVAPDERGIAWHRVTQGWLALKAYDEGVVLEWLAGAHKTTDQRWERLDQVFSEL